MPNLIRASVLAILLGAAGLASGLAEEGSTAYHRGDYATAYKVWLRDASRGIASAQYNLANLYIQGLGVQKDAGQALRWYHSAAGQGFALAQYGLGLMYSSGDGVEQDNVIAAEWYKLAAAGGVANAQNNLAVLYYDGKGVQQDFRQAAEWYRRAAEQGLSAAQYGLGVMEYSGLGVPVDYNRAAHWFRLAAAQGDADAQFALGLLFQFGLGRPINPNEAITWYRLAAAQGHAEAIGRLVELEKKPTAPIKSPTFPTGINAATIKVQSGAKTIISIDGQFFPGDEERFIDAAIEIADAVVLLNSPGGDLQAGIEIGTAIRLKGFTTLVSKGVECSSACALAWLGGKSRQMEEGSFVGFHAASVAATGDVSSVGNALMGAYLSSTLGLPFDAIVYITQPQPHEIRWLSFAEAKQIGISVERP